MSRSHVVITGTGRAGTSFLVQLLTYLGLDTGFSPQRMALHSSSRAGLESDIRLEDSPYIVKSPWFSIHAEEVIQNRKDIIIDHVYIPIRDLHAAAESRRYVTKVTKAKLDPAESDKVDSSAIPGGLWLTREESQQEVVLMNQLYKLVLALSDSTIPVTLLRYPRIVKDSGYLYAKLKPILKEITFAQFESVFNKTVIPSFIHSFNENDS
jgi:hypothetical protein